MSDPIWHRELVDRLPERVPGGYANDGEPASEPTALAGLALVAHDRHDAAKQSAQWLAAQQDRRGSVGVTAGRPTPCWPTSLAMLLWHALDAKAQAPAYADAISRAVDWTLTQRAETLPRSNVFGHDSTLVGWSWAAGTHSWLEPSAMFVLALKAVGHSTHARTREAVRLIVDRQLPDGGCNYGNTTVLGQTLLPHLQPTGLAMMALAGEGYDDPRTEKSLDYLERALSADTATASLCYGMLGLSAHGRIPTSRDALLKYAYDREQQSGGSAYKLALLALAVARDYPFQPVMGTNTATQSMKHNVAV